MVSLRWLDRPRCQLKLWVAGRAVVSPPAPRRCPLLPRPCTVGGSCRAPAAGGSKDPAAPPAAARESRKMATGAGPAAAPLQAELPRAASRQGSGRATPRCDALAPPHCRQLTRAFRDAGERAPATGRRAGSFTPRSFKPLQADLARHRAQTGSRQPPVSGTPPRPAQRAARRFAQRNLPHSEHDADVPGRLHARNGASISKPSITNA